MSIVSLLASSQGLKGNQANIALAKEIANSNNHSAIKELVANLFNKDKKIQSDCIKTLYETGYINPKLLSNYYNDFLELLHSKNNRLVWGSMIALSTIALFRSSELIENLDLIMETINKGSVITIDCGIEILAKLSTTEYFDKTDSLLTDLIWRCPIKQLPMYIEKSLISITTKNKDVFLGIIEKRISECEKDSQNKRLSKLKKKIIEIA